MKKASRGKRGADARVVPGRAKRKEAPLKKGDWVAVFSHRVKNDINLIYNLLYFQKQHGVGPECRAILEETQKRVKTIALMYGHLVRSEAAPLVYFHRYLRELLREIHQSHAMAKKGISLKTNVAPVIFDARIAQACGLIVGELVGHTLKHAFPPGCKGAIRVGLARQKAGDFLLSVSDDGVGLQSEIEWQRAESLGRFLVDSLIESLRGELILKVGHGATFTLRFPVADDLADKDQSGMRQFRR